jgi:hypothetical protein
MIASRAARPRVLFDLLVKLFFLRQFLFRKNAIRAMVCFELLKPLLVPSV